jgi:ethanolamine utilization protein EutA (predicted chaperonin)
MSLIKEISKQSTARLEEQKITDTVVGALAEQLNVEKSVLSESLQSLLVQSLRNVPADATEEDLDPKLLALVKGFYLLMTDKVARDDLVLAVNASGNAKVKSIQQVMQDINNPKVDRNVEAELRNTVIKFGNNHDLPDHIVFDKVLMFVRSRLSA